MTDLLEIVGTTVASLRDGVVGIAATCACGARFSLRVEVAPQVALQEALWLEGPVCPNCSVALSIKISGFLPDSREAVA